MSAPLIDGTILFQREPCRCCDCCNGYCPDFDAPDRWEALYAFTASGEQYIGNGKVMVLGARLDGVPADQSIIDLPEAVNLDWAQIPSQEPPLFEGRHIARFWDLFEQTSLVSRGPFVGNLADFVHLYLDGQHVGWSTTAKPGRGIKVGELPQVREVAKLTRLDLNSAAAAIAAVEEVRA